MRFASVFFFSLGLYFQKKIGMSVIATIKDDNIAKIIVKPNCENNCPASPFMVESGRYTTTVVSVDADTDDTTTLVPAIAASLKSGRSSFRRKQLSNTTIEESTIIPMAITSAPIVTTFSEKPAKLMKISVARREIGIELPTIRLALISPKKINNTSMEKRTPSTSVCATELKEDLMLSAASYATEICIAEFFAPTR